MDSPLITPLQKTREPLIRRLFEARQLHITRVWSDGSQFIDVEPPPSATFLVTLPQGVHTDAFALRLPPSLQFMGEGLGGCYLRELDRYRRFHLVSPSA
jgi:hypothetical protein